MFMCIFHHFPILVVQVVGKWWASTPWKIYENTSFHQFHHYFQLFIVWFPSFHHFQVSLPLFSIISTIFHQYEFQVEMENHIFHHFHHYFIEKWVPRGLVSTPGHAFLAGGPRSRLWCLRWCRWSRRFDADGGGNEWFSLFEGVWMGKCLGKSIINVGKSIINVGTSMIDVGKSTINEGFCFEITRFLDLLSRCWCSP